MPMQHVNTDPETISMFDWMEARYRDLDENGVDVNFRERGAYYRAKKGVEIRSAAEKQANADKSDPFMRNRVLSHCFDGHESPNDYSVDFKRRKCTLPDGMQFSTGGNTFYVLDPVKRKLP